MCRNISRQIIQIRDQMNYSRACHMCISFPCHAPYSSFYLSSNTCKCVPFISTSKVGTKYCHAPLNIVMHLFKNKHLKFYKNNFKIKWNRPINSNNLPPYLSHLQQISYLIPYFVPYFKLHSTNSVIYIAVFSILHDPPKIASKFHYDFVSAHYCLIYLMKTIKSNFHVEQRATQLEQCTKP